MRAYPAALTPDPDGGSTITFRDVPEAITEGDTREEALPRAEDALDSALAMYIAALEPLPTSSDPKADEETVLLSALGMAKAALYDAAREHGVGRAELARRLRWPLPQVSRLLDRRHASRMEHVEAAFAALRLRLIINMVRAA
jgi:antitoxin HicB